MGNDTSSKVQPKRAHSCLMNTTQGEEYMDFKNFGNQLGNDSSLSFSLSRATENPSCLISPGCKKVKVIQVGDSGNSVSVSMGQSYSRKDNISGGTTYRKSDNNLSLGQTHYNGDQNTIFIGPNLNNADENRISMGRTINKGDGSSMLMGHNYVKGDNSTLFLGQPFDKGNGNIISMDQQYEKRDGNILPMGAFYSNGFISIGSIYNRANENFNSKVPIYFKGDHNMVPEGPIHGKAGTSVASMYPSFEKNDSSNLLMGRDINKGRGAIVSLEEPGQKDSMEHNSDKIAIVAQAATSKNGTISKNKEPKLPKKAVGNNFPSNVKNLLSTGIFDGVPVKYVSWSREKNLRGVIKRSCYLCGCKECNFANALTAYEFERHADCKTKHPNVHIYFENGKSIYDVVQELKSTPPELLFEAIQNVTGSPINQIKFQTWKASFQVQTSELQRAYVNFQHAYGKDKEIMPH